MSWDLLLAHLKSLLTNPRTLVLLLVPLGWLVPRLRQWREERSLKRWAERHRKTADPPD
jgi:hypothetical protein